MNTPPNAFLAALREGRPQIGMRSQLCSAIAVEIIGTAGFDYVYLDAEHAANDSMEILQQLQALAGTRAQGVVRLPSDDPALIGRLLDLGLRNVVIPMVERADDARRVVAACRYPPSGRRGVAAAFRGNRFGDYADYYARADDGICLIVQLETRTALDNLESIAAVEGVSGLMIGPADLAADLGHLGDARHPEVRRAIGEAIDRIRATGRAAGMSASGTDAQEWLDRGCAFVSVGGDVALLARQSRALAAQFGLSPDRG